MSGIPAPAISCQIRSNTVHFFSGRACALRFSRALFGRIAALPCTCLNLPRATTNQSTSKILHNRKLNMALNENSEAHVPNGVNQARQDVLSWDSYFMATAFLSAMRSKDPVTQVGAVIVNRQKRIVGIGYNGMPRGCPDDQMPWGKDHGDPCDNKFMYVCHAEMNAVLSKNAADVENCTIYVALFPCNECAKIIIQAGVREVVYYSDKRNDDPSTRGSKRMLTQAGVQFRQFIPPHPQIVIDFDSINHDSKLTSPTPNQ